MAANIITLSATACFFACLTLQVPRISSSDEKVFSFGAKGPTDVELYRQVVNKRARLYQEKKERVRYPPTGTTRNVVSRVEVRMPRHLMQDEVRILSGGPGLNHVTVSIAGWRGRSMEYLFIVYGQDIESIQSTESTSVESTAAGTTEETKTKDYVEEPLEDDVDLEEKQPTSTARPKGSASAQDDGNASSRQGKASNNGSNSRGSGKKIVIHVRKAANNTQALKWTPAAKRP